MNVIGVKNTALATLAGVGSFIANWSGGWDTALAVLVGFMAVDYITGLVVALVFHAQDGRWRTCFRRVLQGACPKVYDFSVCVGLC